jgi:hypothetical protein
MTSEASPKPTSTSLFTDWILEVKNDLSNRGHYWTPTLVTAPSNARTVVLRSLHFDTSTDIPSLIFVVHTDTRSEKWHQLQQDPACTLHFYCSKRKWQMRVQATASLHQQDVQATGEWHRLSSRSQQIYRLQHTPGTPVKDPKAAYTFDSTESGFENFGVLRLEVTSMESLQLEQPDRTDYHVRARWDFEKGHAEYLAP